MRMVIFLVFPNVNFHISFRLLSISMSWISCSFLFPIPNVQWFLFSSIVLSSSTSISMPISISNCSFHVHFQFPVSNDFDFRETIFPFPCPCPWAFANVQWCLFSEFVHLCPCPFPFPNVEWNSTTLIRSFYFHGHVNFPMSFYNFNLLTQPWQCDSQKTRNTTRLKCCACHAKWRWTRPQCCACHENCNASSENIAKVLRLPLKTTFDTWQNTPECHEVSRLPRETKQRDMCNLQERPLLQNLP